MALLPHSGLETHPAGTNVNGIVSGNWQKIEKYIAPTTPDTDAEFTALIRGLMKVGAGSLPASATLLRYNPATKKVEAATVTTRTVQIADTQVRNTASETAIVATPLTLGANALTTAHTVRGVIFGSFANDNAGGNFTLRVKLGAAVITIAFAPPDAAAGDPPTRHFRIEFDWNIRTTGASATVWGSARIHADDISMSATASGTIDTTGSVTATATAQWSAADLDNHLLIRGGYIECVS